MGDEQGWGRVIGEEQGAGIVLAAIRQGLIDKSLQKREEAAQALQKRVTDVLRTHSIFREPPMTVAVYGLATPPAAFTGGMMGGGTFQSAHEQITRAIRTLVTEFCKHAYKERRRGGLLALAAIAIGLEQGRPDRLDRPRLASSSSSSSTAPPRLSVPCASWAAAMEAHVALLVPPVLTCFSDEDKEIRHSACEAFYNIAKVTRGILLPHMDEVFDGLCRLYADVDTQVKEGAQCLDRLVRDIVTESRDFEYSKFIPMLTTRIRVLNPSVLQLVLGWIDLFTSVPQVDMIVYLPQYLDGLFNILSSDNREVRRRAEECLERLLEEIQSMTKDRPLRAQKAMAEVAHIVARRAAERRPEDTFRALHWMEKFLTFQMELEPSLAPDDVDRCPSPLPELSPPSSAGTGAYPRFAAPSRTSSVGSAVAGTSGASPRRSSEGFPGVLAAPAGSPAATSAPGGLRQLVPVLLSGALPCLDDELEIKQTAESANQLLQKAAQLLGPDVPVEAIVDAVLGAMRGPGERERGASERTAGMLLKCFGWLHLLYAQCPRRVLQPPVRDRLVEASLSALASPDDEVAVASLGLIAHLVAPSEDEYGLAPLGESRGPWEASTSRSGSCEAFEEPEGDLFARVCHRIFRLLAEDASVLQKRGELVVRKLCEGVRGRAQVGPPSGPEGGGAERFFSTAARAVASEQDLQFAQRLVQILNRVLLTSRETRALRARLRADALANPRPGAEGEGKVPPHLMEMLLLWFHCPVSTLALCLWLHWFELAAEIAARLASVEMCKELQAQRERQLADLVELLESPIFMRVRLQLLDARHRPCLLRVVQGLLAVLPQEPALKARLAAVETGMLLDRLAVRPAPSAPTTAGPPAGEAPRSCKDWALLQFDRISGAHGWHACAL